MACHASARVDVIALGIVSSPSTGMGPAVKETIMEQLFKDSRTLLRMREGPLSKPGRYRPNDQLLDFLKDL